MTELVLYTLINAMALNVHKQLVHISQALKSLLNANEHDCVGPEA